MNQIVRIALDADVGGFIRNFANADGAAGKFGATISGVGNIAGATGKAIDALAQRAVSAAHKVAAIGVGGLAAFGGMGVAAAKLEVDLRNVQTLMGSNFGEHQFQQMEQSVLDMSRRFPQSAGEIAKGLYNIASSGFYGADALKVLDASTKAAVAGLSNVTESGTAITAVLNAYGLSAKSATDVSDVLFQTVNLGVVNFSQLTNVIGQVVGTAAAAKVSIGSVGAAIATMTLSGISADEAGTSLNRVLQGLLDPSASLQGALRGLGYESGAQALKVDGLRGVMEKLRVASQGNVGTLLSWFTDIRAARGVLALMSADGQNYARVAAQIDDKQSRAGATQRAFAIQSKSAAVAMQEFLNSIHAAAIEIGQYFLPAATAILHIATTVTNAFSEIPGPLKAVIGWVGALGSAFLVLAGIFAAWKLKSAVTNLVLGQLGKGLEATGRAAGSSGTMLTNMGQRLQSINGPFGVTRALVGFTTSEFGKFGNMLSTTGARLTNYSTTITRGSTVVGTIGNAFTRASHAGTVLSTAIGKLGSGAAKLLGSFPMLLALSIGLYSAWQNGRSAAQGLADSITKGLKPQNPESLLKTYDALQSKIDSVQKSLRSAHDSSLSWDPTSWGPALVQWGKNIADITTNIAGIDVIKDSTWDQVFKVDELSKSQAKVVKTIHNLSKNATEIFNILHPSASLQPGELLGLKSDDLAFIARASAAAGIDLTKAFSSSGPARQAAMTEIKKITSFMGDVGVTSTTVSASVIKEYAAMAKAADKAGKGASDAFTKSFDLFKSVDPTKTFGSLFGTEDNTLIPVGQQITAFYTDSITKATNFYNGLQDLQKRGADPAVIQKMLQAGPEAAGAVVQAAVEDSTNGIIAVLNMGESAMAKFQARAAEQARLTQDAIMDPTDTKTKLLPQAQQISNEMFAEGNGATVESVSKALGMDPATVTKVVGQFGITLRTQLKEQDIGNSLNLSGGFGAKSPAEALQSHLFDLANSVQKFTSLAPETTISLIKQLGKVLSMPDVTETDIAKKRVAIDNLFSSVAQVPDQQDKNILFKVFGDEIAKDKMRKVLESTLGPGRANQLGTTGLTENQINFIVGLQGDADAMAKVQSFFAFFKTQPKEQSIILRAVGTEEAIHQADLIDSAIGVLKGKNLPITVDNVQAIINTGEAQKHLDDFKQGKIPDIDANPEPAKKGARDAQGAIDGIHGTTVGVGVAVIHGASAITKAVAGAAAEIVGSISWAEGGMMLSGGRQLRHFADGDHVAQFGGSTTRVWNEPETQGESYIPHARSKRIRSLAILQQTADMFGMAVVPKNAMGFASGGMSGPMLAATIPQASLRPGSPIVVTTNMNFAPGAHVDPQLKQTVKQMMDERDKKLTRTLRMQEA